MSVGYGPLRTRRGNCFWCNGYARLTKDHLVPRWARAIIPEIHRKAVEECVPSCEPCNGRKGPLPPAVFWAVRRDPQARAEEVKRWCGLAVEAAQRLGASCPPAFVAFVTRQMLMPFPRTGGRAAMSPARAPPAMAELYARLGQIEPLWPPEPDTPRFAPKEVVDAFNGKK